ncbi:MAG: hypothetical protein HN392_03325 [Anaerolineae bacterium]|jgi:DNA-binding NarL/FixJ family response regulator|nr:hypothetical protein [Anaerolineae bacterium]MBT7189104.1 hypothetical protein [Anaerolineae bacterium]MBT7783449.1 hypothetical protein [Anaerolineae bacterium]
MELRNVFVVGDSLFAETLIQSLGDSEDVAVVGTAPTLEDALPILQEYSLDAVIMAVVDESVVENFAPILIANPDLAIIHADLSANQMQVITNHSIEARVSDLLTAIMDLPERKMAADEKALKGKTTNNGGVSYEN